MYPQGHKARFVVKQRSNGGEERIRCERVRLFVAKLSAGGVSATERAEPRIRGCYSAPSPRGTARFARSGVGIRLA